MNMDEMFHIYPRAHRWIDTLEIAITNRTINKSVLNKLRFLFTFLHTRKCAEHRLYVTESIFDIMVPRTDQHLAGTIIITEKIDFVKFIKFSVTESQVEISIKINSYHVRAVDCHLS